MLEGNTFATKLKDPEVRQLAYKQFCDHIASGYPKEAFFFDHPEHSVCRKTMERYIQESPDEFPVLLMERAKALRLKHWIDRGIKLMEGGYKGGSPVVWQTIMRNIFKEIGWDQELKKTEINLEEFQKLVDLFSRANLQNPKDRRECKEQLQTLSQLQDEQAHQLQKQESEAAQAPPNETPSWVPPEVAQPKKALQPPVSRPADHQTSSPPIQGPRKKSVF